MVDTLGLILRAWVHSASEQDRSAVRRLIAGDRPVSPRLEVVWADWGYRSGPLARDSARVGRAPGGQEARVAGLAVRVGP